VLLFTFVFALLFTEIPSGSVDGPGELAPGSAQSASAPWGPDEQDGRYRPAALIAMLMFLGRVGPLAALEAMARRSRRKQPYRLGREDAGRLTRWLPTEGSGMSRHAASGSALGSWVARTLNRSATR
jgi:hypothetical protein